MDVGERLLETLQELTENQLHTFVFYLGSFPDRSTRIPRGKLENVSRVQLAQLLMQYFPGRELEVATHALEKIPRMDLLQDLHVTDRRSGRETLMREVAQREAAPAQPIRVSEKQLMTLAKKMGKKWKQIGIEFLGVENSVLEQIEEENPNNVAMRAFHMLLDWRNRERGEATAALLYHILNREGVNLDHDAYEFLMERT